MATRAHGTSPSKSAGAIDRRDILTIAAGGVASAAFGSFSPGPAEAAERVSSLGVYSGYSGEAYDGWARTSVYVPVRDGVKLAVDIFRPTAGGAVHAERLPMVWIPKRYQRATIRPDGSLVTTIDTVAGTVSYDLTAQRLLRHGYVVAAVDRRGTGASFGVHSDFSDPLTARDGYDLTEWFAAQPWCDGNVGMFGASYEGEMQLRVAGTAPPHLKAIMPEVSPFDWYRLVQGGGIYHGTQFTGFQKMIGAQDVDPNNAPVDEDKDRALLTAALAEHRAHNDYSATLGKLPWRDSVNPVTGERNWLKRHGGTYTPGLSASGIAVYHRVGWFARVAFDQLLWFVNHKQGPKKMLIGPWGGGVAETPEDRAMWTAEAHRFFDHFLKGVPNGIMDEPPIHSSVATAHSYGVGEPWRGLSQWPLPNEQKVRFFFEAGPTGSTKSANDGRLVRTQPGKSGGRDDYLVNYDIAYAGGNDPARPGAPAVDHAAYDAQGLTYTTDPLDHDVEITGHGIAHLWVTSSADDGDFWVKVEDVAPDGRSTYVSRGAQRASRRKLGAPPYDYIGMPWETCLEADAAPLPKGVPTELVFALTPISYIARRGHRLRVTVTGADRNIGETPRLSPAPTISLHRSARHASSVTLPIIPPSRT